MVFTKLTQLMHFETEMNASDYEAKRSKFKSWRNNGRGIQYLMSRIEFSY